MDNATAAPKVKLAKVFFPRMDIPFVGGWTSMKIVYSTILHSTFFSWSKGEKCVLCHG